jgi:hypothetical protein
MPKLSKRESKGNFTPAPTGLAPVPKVRLKKRPRGKPFPKGNTQGLATRFIKGVCPNPLGRAHSKEIGQALRDRAAQVDPLDAAQRTYAMELADEWIASGLGGNVTAIEGIANRLEGKPAQSIQVRPGPDPVDIIAAGMTKMYFEIGPPEGAPISEAEAAEWRQLEESNEEPA